MLIANNGIVEHIQPVPLRTVKSKREITAAWERIKDALSTTYDENNCELLKGDLALISEHLEST